MICKDIGLLNRNKRRAVNAALRERGLPPLVMTRQRIDAHLRKLTEYIVHIKRAAMATAIGKEDELTLVRYVTGLGITRDNFIGVDPGEKVDHTGYLNLESDNIVDQQREMIALMAQAPGPEDPLEHYMLSWDAGEQPTHAQVNEAVKTVLKVLGLDRHQTIHAAHSNTAHYHVHIAVNRVDRVTLKRTAAGEGYQLNGLHQAMAIIEFEQGWSENEGALYRADEFGVVHIASGERVRDRDGPTSRHPRHEKPERTSEAFDAVTASLSEGAKLHEEHTNTWSFERIGKMIAAPIIRSARSFDDMHFALAEEGIGYDRRGSAQGAVLTMQGRAIKATTAGREMSIANLQDRPGFGTFEPRPETLELSTPRLRLIDEDRPTKQYRRAKNTHKTTRAALTAELSKATAAALRTVHSQASELYALIDAHDWKGNGRNLNLARALVAADSSAADSEIMSVNNAALKSVALGGSFPAMPQWRPWLDLDHLDAIQPVHCAVLLSPIGASPATPVVAPGYECRRVKRECHYFDNHGRRAFRDTGSFIAVDRATDPAAVASVLQLAARKWAGSSVVVVGDRRFMRLCASLAVDMDIDIENEFVRKEMARLRAVRDRTIEAEQQKKAEAAAASLLAEPRAPAASSPVLAVVHKGTDKPPPAIVPDEQTSISGDPPRRNLVWDPFPDYAEGVPELEAWGGAHRAKAGASVLGRLANAVIADPHARKVYIEMLAQGVWEADRIKQQAAAFDRQQAQQGVASQGATGTIPVSPPDDPILNSNAVENARLAMLSREFHSENWRVEDYWAPLNGPRCELPTKPRSIDDVPGALQDRESKRASPVMPARRSPAPSTHSISR